MPHFITFQVNDQKFALPLESVERVIQVIEIRPLPKMPGFLHGIVNLYGEVIPVVNIHFLFGGLPKEIELSDQLIIARTALGNFTILVDKTLEVMELGEDEVLKSENLIYNDQCVKGVVKLEEGMLLVSDIDRFLTKDELEFIEKTINNNQSLVEVE